MNSTCASKSMKQDDGRDGRWPAELAPSEGLSDEVTPELRPDSSRGSGHVEIWGPIIPSASEKALQQEQAYGVSDT